MLRFQEESEICLLGKEGTVEAWGSAPRAYHAAAVQQLWNLARLVVGVDRQRLQKEAAGGRDKRLRMAPYTVNTGVGGLRPT